MQINASYEFGRYRIDATQKLLLRDDETVPLTPKVFDLLLALVENHGRVMSKESLLKLVWPDTYVEETNLSKGVFTLRAALGEGYIETLSKRGYRFNAPVKSAPILHGETQPEAVPTPVAETPIRKPARLRWIWVALAGALVIAAGAKWLWLRPTSIEPIQSMVVLPFVNLSGDVSQEYFSDGLTEEIINALAPIPGLRVVARTSSFQFKGKGEDVRTIGRKLGVDAVLEGSVRMSGGQLRVTAQLNDTRNGYHYWSRSWDHGMKDVFAVQLQIAREVVQALGRRSSVLPIKALTKNFSAYDYYMQGAFFAERVDNGKLPAALVAFDKALKEDPSFAAAYAFIGRAYLRSAVVGAMSAAKAFPLARQNVVKALALDPDLGAANAVYGAISFYSDWDWETAEKAFRRATASNPSDANAHHEFAHYLLAMGRFDEAFAESQKQIAINPVGVEALSHVAFHYIVTGDLPRAIDGAKRALAVDPHHQVALTYLEKAYELIGQFDMAIEALARRKIATPQLVASLRDGWRKKGEPGYWLALYESRRHEAMPEDLRTRIMAAYCARLGRKEEMLAWLEKGIEVRDTSVVNINVEPMFAPYRGDPDFRRLVRKVGLPISVTR